MAMLQIAIVLASASIITGARLLLVGSGIVGMLGVFLFINGYTLLFGAPELKHDKAEILEKAGIQINLQCLGG
jgi:membrane-bound ClpP family serine protease